MEPNSQAKTTEQFDASEEDRTESVEDRQEHLRRVFEDVTGTVVFVEPQESTSSRHLDSDDESSVSEYVTSMAQTDGLSDAITPPDDE